jgi:hypothetical protein
MPRIYVFSRNFRWVNMNMPEKALWKNLNLFFENIAIAYDFLNLFFCLQWQSFLYLCSSQALAQKANHMMDVFFKSLSIKITHWYQMINLSNPQYMV